MLARGYIGWEDGWRCKAQQQLLLCSALLLLLVNRVLSEPVQAAILVEPTTVRIQETTTQAVGVSIAGQVVAVSARGAGTEAPRKHTRRKSLAENMVHRPRLEGIGARPIDESFGRRQPATPPHAQRRRIPRIFHQIFISGTAEYQRVCQDPKTRLKCSTRDSCLMYLQGWQQHLWNLSSVETLISAHYPWALDMNLSSVEALISAHYPWALDMFRSYDVEVKRADVGRVFILHHYGGLYLDLDCRCFRDLADTLTDYDFVIQGSGFEGVNNGMMASAPGLPLWQSVVQLLEERSLPTGDKWKDAPIYQTGPNVLTTVFQQYLGIPQKDLARLGYNGGVFYYDDLVVKVWPMSTWFMPCWITDTECRKAFEQIPDPELGTDLTDIAGYHQFSSIWG